MSIEHHAGHKPSVLTYLVRIPREICTPSPAVDPTLSGRLSWTFEQNFWTFVHKPAQGPPVTQNWNKHSGKSKLPTRREVRQPYAVSGGISWQLVITMTEKEITKAARLTHLPAEGADVC